MLSSLPIFYFCSIKLSIDILNQVDKYMRYCLLRGSDINVKKSPLAAWKLVTRPKSKGGLGVIRLRAHNDTLLMKHLHNFFSENDLPWVKLIWEKYYIKGKLARHIMKGSFWWRGMLKLLDIFKGIAKANFRTRDAILLWSNSWNGSILQHEYPQFYSFAKDNQITVKAVLELDSLFHLPLSLETY
jgi:hypothetical protein